MHDRFRKDKPFYQVQCVLLPRKQKSDSLASAFVGIGRQASSFVGTGRIATQEERFVLLKPVEHFSFTQCVLRDLLCNYFSFITS